MSNPDLSKASVLSRRDMVWREIAGETVIVDPDGEVIMGLNGTGGRVWDRLDGERSLGDIAGELAKDHGVDPDQVLGDVLAFAEQLIERNLASPAS